MCLVLLMYRAHPHADVILAGNRDEFYRRPTAPPALIGTAPCIYAGRDLEAGGTWMGRNEHGLLAALTNRRTAALPEGGRSRGEIVRTLLEQPNADAAVRAYGALDIAAYRPFNVLFGDAGGFYYAASARGGPPRALQPGCYALSNADLDDASWPKVARSLQLLRTVRDLPGERLLRALQAFLCDSTQPDDLTPVGVGEEVHGAMGAVFIETPDYGTVSSTVLTEGGALGTRYYYAEAAAMRAARGGWAGTVGGNGQERRPPAVPHSDEGSPFRRLRFEGA